MCGENAGSEEEPETDGTPALEHQQGPTQLGEENYKRILDCLGDGVYFIDRDRVISYWNQGAKEITGYSADETLGTRCADNLLMHVDSDGKRLCTTSCPVAATIETGDPMRADVFLHHKDGHRVPVTVRSLAVRDESGEIIGAAECFTDNSPENALIKRAKGLQDIALTDIETGTANREYAEMILRTWLAAKRETPWPFGVVIMDIERFTHMKASYGQDTSQRILKMVAKTLLNCAKTHDLIGRWGESCFVALVANVTSNGLAMASATFRNLVAESTLSDRSVLRVSISTSQTIAQETDSIASLMSRISHP